MFFIERSNASGGWDIIMASPEPLKLGDVGGRPGEYPVNYELPAFAGLPGMEARIRFDDAELERYVWGKVPANPNDADPFMVPGWELCSQNDWPVEALAVSSWMSWTAKPTSVPIEIGSPSPKTVESKV